LAAVAAVVLGAGMQGRAYGQVEGAAPSEELARLETRLAGARDRAVDRLAPSAYERASDRLRQARRRVDRHEEEASLRRVLDEARRAIEAAEEAADDVRPTFRDALAARDLARAQEAAARAPAAWKVAEEELERGGRAVEGGDEPAESVRRASELYARAARAAKRDRLLGEAENAREGALSAGASELAPETFAKGEAALAAGIAALADVGDGRASASGKDAVRAFHRAAWIAGLTTGVRTRTVSLEQLVNDHEADLARLAAAAGVEGPDLQDPDDTTVERVESAIRDLLAANAKLTAELEAAGENTRQLSDQVSSLETALTDSERRFTDARTRLLAREARDNRLRETRALFTPEEGEVFLRGEDLVLRLYGLTFESGSADIDPAMEPLLTKVERVLTDFTDAAIRIEGHTDSRGNENANRALSQRRAIAVREYLLSRLPISSSRVQATGFGEDRPIAPNDTEAGRARNRRIEITLMLPAG